MFFTTTASSHCNLWLGSMIFQFYLLLSFPIVPALFRFNILFAFIILMKILCPMWLCDCICYKRISPTLTDPLVTLTKSKLFWSSQSNRFSKLHISSSVLIFFFFCKYNDCVILQQCMFVSLEISCYFIENVKKIILSSRHMICGKLRWTLSSCKKGLSLEIIPYVYL